MPGGTTIDVSGSALRAPDLGTGIYTFPEATEILRGIGRPLTSRQLRYWMTSGLTPSSYRTDEGTPILSFDDLVSLEVVGRFRSVGTSLQRVRKLEAALRGHFPDFDRPFAYRVFFTDGASIWAQELGEDGPMIELVGRQRNHFVWRPAIETFAKQIRYGPDSHASGWDLSPWVEIDPSVQFGTPVVRGTRVPVRTIAANLKAGTPEDVADWYGLTVQQVQGVIEYLALH